MKISEFVVGRDANYDAVRKYIKRHQDQFNGHLGSGDEIELDEIALSILEEKYPLIKPIQVVEDTEARKQLIDAQNKIIELQQQLLEVAPMIAEAKTAQLLLEAKDQELLSWQTATEELQADLERVKEESQTKDQELADLRAQLEKEQSKSWWTKLWNG